MAKLELDAIDLVQNVTINVKIKKMKVFRLRVWLGMQMLWLACWMFPFRCEISEMDAPTTEGA